MNIDRKINKEIIKINDNFLTGTIVNDLKNRVSGCFDKINSYIIRFYGMHEQDDRYLRLERYKQKLEPLYSIMLRLRIPAGVINCKQWLKINYILNKYTLYKSARLTNRQTIQIHGVPKNKLKDVHKILNSCGIDTIGTAGDLIRNVVCSSISQNSYLHKKCINLSKRISNYFLPKNNSYYELWINGNKNRININKKYLKNDILGKSYLPKKFKIGICIPPYNDIDIYSNDISMICINKVNKIVGFNILVGGNLSTIIDNYSKKYFELFFISYNNVIKFLKSIIIIHRNYGDRNYIGKSRLRHTLYRIGLSNLKKIIKFKYKINIYKFKKYEIFYRQDYFNWVKKDDNKWYITIYVKNGRIINEKKYMIKKFLYEFSSLYNYNFFITSNHNITITEVNYYEKNKIDSLLKKYNLFDNKYLYLMKNSMSCVSYPTCKLAMAESENYIYKFISTIDKIMKKYKVNIELNIRITGCFNNCGRAILSEIGLVGRSLNYYDLYLGGNSIGTRFSFLYKNNLNIDNIILLLDNTIEFWSLNKINNESYGDFIYRNKEFLLKLK